MSRDFTDDSAGSSEKHRETLNSYKISLFLFMAKIKGGKTFKQLCKITFSKESPKLLSCSNWEVSLVYSNEKRIQKNT